MKTLFTFCFLTILCSFIQAQTFNGEHTLSKDTVLSFLRKGAPAAAEDYAAPILRDLDQRKRAEWYAVIANCEAEEGYASIALKHYRTARHFGAKSADKTFDARASNGIASAMIDLGQYDSVMFYIQDSKASNGEPENFMLNGLAEGRYWLTQNQFDKALTLFQQVLDMATTENDRTNSALALSAIGGVYFSHHPDMHDAVAVYEKAITYLDSAATPHLSARNYGRLANCYMVLGDLSSAERYLRRARRLADLSGNLPVRSYVLGSWATYYAEKGLIKEAIGAAQEPIAIKRMTGQYRQLQNDLLNISEMYLVDKNYKEARKTLTEGRTIAHHLRDIVYLKYFYDRFSQLDSVTGNFKGAYANLKRSYFYRDSVFSNERIKAVHEVSEKYQAEQQKKTIAEKELVIEQQKYSQAVTVAVSAGGFLFMVIIAIVLYNKNRLKMQREKQRQDHLRLQSIVNTQEQVQQRIARDLHDGLIQVLGTAKLTLQSIRPMDTDTVIKQRITSASGILDDAVQEARNISHQLLPYALMKDGLIPSLEELLYKNFIEYSFTHTGEVPLFPQDTLVNIYRICQELVTNINRHAGASHVDITVEASEAQVKITFADNGRGFDTVGAASGAGLPNMQTRAALIGAALTVRSKDGEGTTTILIVRK